MPNEILIKNGAGSIILADTAHSPTAGTSLSGARTHQLNLANLAVGSYRQSAKVDFGTPRGREWLMRAAIVPASAPTAGGVADFWLGFSDDATAANNNPGNLSGSDGAWNGYGAAAGDATEAVPQLYYVGSLVATADNDTFIAEIGMFVPALRYGSVVVQNRFSVAFVNSGVQMSVHMIPIVDEVQ